MPAFRYEAADAAGKTDKGVIEADSARQARTVLRARGLTPLVVDALGAQATKRGGSSFGKRLSAQENALVTRQLASLLVAGLPLDEALAALADQAERAYVGELLAAIRAEVVGGSSLSVALAQHPKDFPDIYRALVSAGEHSGNPGLVLTRLADYIESRNALTSKIKLAFTYPAIVTVVAFAIVIFLLSYVVPQVVSVFANQAEAADAHDHHAVALGFRAELGVAGGDRAGGARPADSQSAQATGAAVIVAQVAADSAAIRQARAGLQHGAVCQHVGDFDQCGCADSAGAAGRR